jgi:S-adenosyl-L-methionine hydrolase (adenosine-forming)
VATTSGTNRGREGRDAGLLEFAAPGASTRGMWPSMSYGWVSFTTDYGRGDGFVAACLGVIARTAPHVRVIDVTHDVPPGDVRRGATVLAQTVGYLPPAVHLAVVDPGVGTARRGLAVVAGAGVLVGPDNGLLLPAAGALGGITAAYELAEREFWLPGVSRTFHGRDVFAPVVAHLANGVDPPALGPAVAAGDLVRLPEPAVTARPGELTAEVLTIDGFGNVQLAATASDLRTAGFEAGQPLNIIVASPPAAPSPRTIPNHPFVPDPTPQGPPPVTGPPTTIPREPFLPEPPPHGLTPRTGSQPSAGRTVKATVGHTFADVGPGQLVVLIDSAGHVAIAANGASAVRHLTTTPGALVILRKS